MYETSISELDKQIKSKIFENIEIINKQSRNYLKDIIVLINREIGINKILSIILFGSQLPEKNHENSKFSDCDVLIIFKNRVSNRHIKEIERYFIALEIKHDFRELNSHLLNKVLFVLQDTTGMFLSHFLTKQKYWENATFHKIFRVNKVISKIFAPRNIVLSSVIDNSNILYGEDLRDSIKDQVEREISPGEMLKSLIMNIMISIFSILTTPLKSINSMKYQLEAVKWSLRASNYYGFKDSKPLKTIVNRFMHFEWPKFKKRAEKFYSKFLQLRKDPHPNFLFLFKCPFRILKIHAKGIIFKKLSEKLW